MMESFYELTKDTATIFLAIALVVLAYFKWSYQYWARRNFPYLEPTIPFGNLGNPGSDTFSLGEVTYDAYQLIKQRKLKHCGIYAMAWPSLMVADLDLLKQILAKDFNYFTDRAFYLNEKDEPIGAHLFALTGDKWKSMRQKVTPTFSSGKMKAMFQTLVDVGSQLEEYMKEQNRPDEPIDIKDLLGCFTTDVVGSCAFGLECNTFKEPNSPFRTFGKRIFETTTPWRNFIRNFAFNFPKAGRMLGITVLPKEISDFYTRVVRETINFREQNHFTRKDFLQLMLDIRKNHVNIAEGKTAESYLSDNEFVSQCFLFWAAGFETSATTMTFTLFELARHPEIQQKVREEVLEVLERHDNKITYDSISEMKYMDQVIDETLRLYPPVPILTRVCTKDYQIPGEDRVLKKGTRVIVSVKGIHYDEENFENAKKFDPDRFSEENRKSRHPYAHIPFGEGPRVCIGMRFGLMQSKVGLTSLLRHYKFTVNERTQVPIKMAPRSIVTTAEGGVWLDYKKA